MKDWADMTKYRRLDMFERIVFPFLVTQEKDDQGITYIQHHHEWSCLTCVLDLAAKEIIGYTLSTKPDSKLIKEALDNGNYPIRQV